MRSLWASFWGALPHPESGWEIHRKFGGPRQWGNTTINTNVIIHEISFHICKVVGGVLELWSPGAQSCRHPARRTPPVRARRQFRILPFPSCWHRQQRIHSVELSSRATVKVVADIFIIFTCSGWAPSFPIPSPPFCDSGVPLNCPWLAPGTEEIAEAWVGAGAGARDGRIRAGVMLFWACHAECHLLGFVRVPRYLQGQARHFPIFTLFSFKYVNIVSYDLIMTEITAKQQIKIYANHFI